MFVYVILLASFAALSTAVGVLRINGARSVCFNKNWEANAYGNFNRMSQLKYDVAVFVDPRYANALSQRAVSRLLASVNGPFQRINVHFNRVHYEVLPTSMINQNGYSTVDAMLPATRTTFRKWGTYSRVKDQIRRGRVVVILGHIRRVVSGNAQRSTIGGLSSLAAFHSNSPYLWVNVDPYGTGRTPLVSERSFMHELGHNFGLFHTFQTNGDLCRVGDIIDDTSPTQSGLTSGCGSNINICGRTYPAQRRNLMSYSSCSGATRLTAGQLRRMRCTVENSHVIRNLGSPTGNAVPTGTSSGGGGGTVRISAADSRQIGKQCKRGVAGTCQHTGVTQCANYRSNLCDGSRFIKCCVGGSGAIVEVANYTGMPEEYYTGESEVNPNEVAEEDTIMLDVQTYHIGDTLELSDIKVDGATAYLWETSALEKAPADELAGREIAFTVEDDVVKVRMFELKDESPVDRGQYSLVFKTADRELYSIVFTVDANACTLDMNRQLYFKQPYGVLRTEKACTEREGEKASDKGDLVCCVGKLHRSMLTIDFVQAVEEINGTIVTPDAPDSFYDSYGQVELREDAHFWGAPINVKLIDGLKTSVTLSLEPTLVIAGEEPTAPANPTSITLEKSTTDVSFTPRVSKPGVYRMANENNVAMQSLWIVSMPCKTAEGVAGYCRPTTEITDGVTDAIDTSSVVTCDSGYTTPCAGLALGDVAFACCASESTSFQTAANYRDETPASIAMLNVVIALVAAAILF